MRALIVTDAWEPQVNGVVRTLKSTRARLRSPKALTFAPLLDGGGFSMSMPESVAIEKKR